MKAEDLYRDILGKLSQIQDDKEKLSQVLNLLENQILAGIEHQHNRIVPAKYKSIVRQITNAVYGGFTCFLNPETLEIEQVDRKGYFEPEEIAEQNDDMVDEYGLDYLKWEEYIRFDPFGRADLIRIMEKFVFQLNNTEVINQLKNALEGKESVSRFMHIIRDSGLEDNWNEFRKEQIEDYVSNLVVGELSGT